MLRKRIKLTGDAPKHLSWMRELGSKRLWEIGHAFNKEARFAPQNDPAYVASACIAIVAQILEDGKG